MRIFVCNDAERARDVVLTFRGQTHRRHVHAGRMVEIVLGEPRLVDAMPTHETPGAAAGPDGAAAKLPARA